MTARDRLIFTAVDLLRERGVAGTGVAEILERGDVSRRSIYLNFPGGKTELMGEATRVSGAFIGAQIATFAGLPSPAEALAAFTAEWKKVVTDSGFEAGCPIVSASLSRALTPEIADLAGHAFSRWQSTLAGSLQHHGVDAVTSTSLATTILAAVEGAVVMCIAQKSTDPLDHIETHLQILLDHHVEICERSEPGT